MRILLDECIDVELRHHFGGHDCQTCRYAGFAGLANGELLGAAEEAGFQALMTVDKNIRAQQSLRGRSISVLIIRARSTTIEGLLSLMPAVLAALDNLPRGEVVQVGGG